MPSVMARRYIQDLFYQNNFDFDKYDFFIFIYNFIFIILNVNQLIFNEYIYNIDNLRDIIKWDYIYFNIDQKITFDILCQVIISSEKDMFFLDEFDNIEKIFLINLMLMKI